MYLLLKKWDDPLAGSWQQDTGYSLIGYVLEEEASKKFINSNPENHKIVMLKEYDENDSDKEWYNHRLSVDISRDAILNMKDL